MQGMGQIAGNSGVVSFCWFGGWRYAGRCWQGASAIISKLNLLEAKTDV
jgi:hypothetical protein